MANPNLVPLGNPLSNIAVPGGHGLGDDLPLASIQEVDGALAALLR